MTTLARSYKYRIYPTVEQAALLTQWQTACLEVQRLCILQRRIANTKMACLVWVKRGQDRRTKQFRDVYYKRRFGKYKRPSFAEQSREITEIRRHYPDLAAVPADTMNAIAKRVDIAYGKLYKKAGGNPRWAQQACDIGLLFRGNRGTALAGTGRKRLLTLAGAMKLGAMKIRVHRAIPTSADMRQVIVTRAADGWYASISCSIDAPVLQRKPTRSINGVDIGCIHEGEKQRIAVVDDGRIYTAVDTLKREQQRLKTLTRLVSKGRRTKGGAKSADPKSNRTKKRRATIARLSQRITRQRTHQQQYIAKRLVDTADAVAFEALNLQKMRAKGGAHKKGLNRSMATAAPGKLISLCEEKGEAAGVPVIKVNARNTTQACSVCGTIGVKKTLSQRVWTCSACGATHDRDVNAAKNIALRARSSE